MIAKAAITTTAAYFMRMTTFYARYLSMK